MLFFFGHKSYVFYINNIDLSVSILCQMSCWRQRRKIILPSIVKMMHATCSNKNCVTSAIYQNQLSSITTLKLIQWVLCEFDDKFTPNLTLFLNISNLKTNRIQVRYPVKQFFSQNLHKANLASYVMRLA
jgi:hypothetical protein